MAQVRLRLERIRVSCEHLPLTLAVTVVNAALLTFVTLDTAPPATLLIWLSLVLAQALARITFWYFYRRSSGHRAWPCVHFAGALVSGALWGIIPFIIPLDDAHLLFVALVIGGMCAGAATVHATYFPAAAAFILPAACPLATRLLLIDGKVHEVAGLMIYIFVLALCIASLKFRDLFDANVLAHLQLRAEMDSHRATETKLRQAQRLEAVGRLTAGVAHDFNNLLMAISGSAGLVAMRLPAEHPCKRQIENIMDAVSRGSTLTRQLLAFGRKQSLQPVLVNINDVVNSMERLVTSTLGSFCRAKLDLWSLPLCVYIDVAQLECAILNLVINARDAMPRGGVVTLTTAPVERTGDVVGKFVLLAVSDTGTGMSESVSQQAFDPFFTTKQMGEGSGLGLSQVYGLVQQSGGVVEIDSHLGRGTSINIYLPQQTPTG